jgi:hypothetical protein
MIKNVHTKGALTVLPHYIESRFCEWKTPGIGGACLLMQLGAIYHRTLGVPKPTIQKALSNSDLPPSYGQGWPLQTSLLPFKGMSPWTVTGVIKHDVASCLEVLNNGMPLLFVHDCNLISESYTTWDGVAKLNPYNYHLSMSSGYNHSLLVIGADTDQRCLIARESRRRYTNHGGMLKIDINQLHKHGRGWRMFELVFAK